MAKKKQFESRQDGWANVLTRQGTTQDKRTYTRFNSKSLLTEGMMQDLFVDEGLGRKIITKPVDAMIRAWFTVDSDIEGVDSDLQAMIDELKIRKYLKELLYWNKAFGGAIMVLGINDGGKLEDDLNEYSIKSIKFIEVYDRFRVSLIEYNKDKESDNFGKPEIYNISPLGGSPFKVHFSRCIVLDGMLVPKFVKILNNGWGTSVYQAIYDQLSDIGTAFSSIGHIVETFNETSIAIKNLLQLIMSGKEQVIKDRLNLMDLSRHVLNTILLDADNEKLEKHASSLAGLPETLDRYMQFLSSVTGIPVMVLFGRSAAGMNATGENDIKEWYDTIDEERKDIFLPVLERIIKILMLSREGYFNGKEPKKWFINFNSLWQRTSTEEASLRLSISQADINWINAGVLDPEDIRVGRFSGGKFNENFVLIENSDTREKKEIENEE